MSKRVVFIDSSVADYQVLIDGLPSDAEWFVLGAASGGLEQMASILSGYSELDAIDVISHGRVGALYLGSTVLDSGNLASYGVNLPVLGVR